MIADPCPETDAHRLMVYAQQVQMSSCSTSDVAQWWTTIKALFDEFWDALVSSIPTIMEPPALVVSFCGFLERLESHHAKMTRLVENRAAATRDVGTQAGPGLECAETQLDGLGSESSDDDDVYSLHPR